MTSEYAELNRGTVVNYPTRVLIKYFGVDIFGIAGNTTVLPLGNSSSSQ